MAAIVTAERMRRSLRRQRLFRDRLNPLETMTDLQLYKAFRFRRQELIDICDELKAEIEYPVGRKGTLPPILQVCLALRFYATGTFQSAIGELTGVVQSTTCRTIKRVTLALKRRMATWVRFPTQSEADVQKQKFYSMAGFPNVIGCVDGTHVRIIAPSVNEHEYVNRKNFHSVNVQIVCDADLKIINCVAKWPGSVHDARILRESHIFSAFEGHPKPVSGFILGDSGYMMRDWLFTPMLHTRTRKDEAYNSALCGTRCTVERCIGVLKRRWHCLHGELRLKPATACNVICACVVLHNRATNYSDDFGDSDEEDDDDHDAGMSTPLVVSDVSERVRAAADKAARDRLIDNYF